MFFFWSELGDAKRFETSQSQTIPGAYKLLRFSVGRSPGEGSRIHCSRFLLWNTKNRLMKNMKVRQISKRSFPTEIPSRFPNTKSRYENPKLLCLGHKRKSHCNEHILEKKWI